MKYYFSSCPPNSLEGKIVLENNGYILHSQYREKYLISQWIDLKNTSQHNPHIFVDSGAYTAHTKGVTIDIDEYIEYINTIINDIEACAALDVIGNAEESWNNYLYMRGRVSIPDKILYTFHYGEDFCYLQRAIDYFKEHNIAYMAVGGVALIKDASLRLDFINQVQNILKDTNIKIHLFGVTDYKIVRRIQCESVDSTQHIMAGAFGKILVPTHDGKIKAIRPDSLSGDTLRVVLELCEKYNTTVNELIDLRNSRVEFNVHVLIDNQDLFNYISDEEQPVKEGLW